MRSLLIVVLLKACKPDPSLRDGDEDIHVQALVADRAAHALAIAIILSRQQHQARLMGHNSSK
jgi:hypothetical protein